ncbi:hypothetical protein K7A41_09440 [Sphingobacterium sp. InxBP1]|uniref:hypothetical protein n=1 Tax=Sphingobacterium sp. InxBP1 TaxID=2870328 RepID=UPI002243F60D|nr:hypothetical protein [Sphingobacterium sp. InxBP1]MCW8311445.1 hypothetical protein [Sphingobacterium sp. InxBP1]
MEDHLIEEIANRSALKLIEWENDLNKRKFKEKIQVTRSDIIKAFDLATYNNLISHKGLKPVRQDGRTSKIYYDAAKVLQLTQLSHHK